MALSISWLVCSRSSFLDSGLILTATLERKGNNRSHFGPSDGLFFIENLYREFVLFFTIILGSTKKSGSFSLP